MTLKHVLGYALISIPFIAVGVILPICLFGLSGFVIFGIGPLAAVSAVCGLLKVGDSLINT